MSPRVTDPAQAAVWDEPNAYYGPAVASFDDGTEFPVIARLTVERPDIGFGSWEGELTDPQDSETHPLYRRIGERFTLKIGDRIGTALIMQLTRRREAGAELVIQGAGPPPLREP